MRLRSAYRSKETPKYARSSSRKLRESTNLSRGASPASHSRVFESNSNEVTPLDKLLSSVLSQLSSQSSKISKLNKDYLTLSISQEFSSVSESLNHKLSYHLQRKSSKVSKELLQFINLKLKIALTK